MAIVRHDKSVFEKHLKLNSDVLEKMNLFGTPTLLSGNELELEINPDRPDLLPLHGYLRAFKAFLGKDKGLKDYKVLKPGKNDAVFIDKSVKDVRPFTACCIIRNFELDDSKIKELIDIQEKLHSTLGRNRRKVAIGIYPLEKIKLPIKYDARAPKDIKFMPLESNRVMTGSQILKSHPAGIAYGHLLKDARKYPIFVDSAGKVLSMPPIINSQDTGKVTGDTKSLFVECSGHDPLALRQALNILSTAMADMGADIQGMTVHDSGKKVMPDLEPDTMKVSVENVNKLLGLDLKAGEIKGLLERMGYDVSGDEVKIPAWRSDVMHEVDIIEDIAIAYGYDRLEPDFLDSATVGEEDRGEALLRKIASLLSGLGMLEVSTFHLVRPEEAKRMKVSKPLAVVDSKTDHKVLRPSLLIPALRLASENKDHEYPQNLFEIGKVFERDKKQEPGVKEETCLIFSLSPGNFTDVKQRLEYLMSMFGLKPEMHEKEMVGLIHGRTAGIKLKGKEIGYMGEVHPDCLHAWGAKMPMAVCEVNAEAIVEEVMGQPK